MNEHELFWERVHAALDERRDPLSDPRVQESIAVDPARLDEVLALRGRLDAVRYARPQRSYTRVAIAAAVVVLIGVVSTVPEQFFSPATVATGVASGTGAGEKNCSGTVLTTGAVLAFRATVVTETADSRTTIDFDGEHVVSSRETFSKFNASTSNDPAGSQPAYAAIVSTSSLR